jgi:hypothetical protein
MKVSSKMAETEFKQVASESLATYEKLSAKLHQLRCMITTIYGDGHENFLHYSNEVTDGYLWACASMVEECEGLTEQLMNRVMEAARPNTAEASNV